MEIKNARELLGADKIIGVTAKTIEQAKAAETAGADYLGSGAVFGTSTKADAKPMELDLFQEICESVTIPVVAIGVPTVVDAATIISDHLEHVLEKQGYSEEEIERFIYEILTEETTDVMVTPKNIDESVNQISKDLAKVLNHCFQKRDNYGSSSISFYEKEDMKRE